MRSWDFVQNVLVKALFIANGPGRVIGPVCVWVCASY